MDKIDTYLEEFKEIADKRLKEVEGFVEKHYNFFQTFFVRDNLEKLEWIDIQEMRKYLHSFNSNALAGKKAFGNPNHPIEFYRNSFIFLNYGNESLEERVRKFSSDKQYKINNFGDSTLSEIFGNLFADDFMFFNSRDQFALKFLGITIPAERGDRFVDKFFKFNEALKPIKEKYLQIVGRRTTLPINLELDQFFSYLEEKYNIKEKKAPAIDYWVVGTGADGERWDNFQSDGVITLGWDNLGDFTLLSSKDGIKEKLAQEYPSETSQSNCTLACYQFAFEAKIGDIVFAKKGKQSLLGCGRIVSDYIFDETKQENKHLRKVEWLAIGDWEMDGSFAIKSFTQITKYPDFVQNLLKTVGLLDATTPPLGVGETMSFDELFITDKELQEIVSLFQYKKNIVLQGAPGVGKTFFAKRLAYALLGEKNNNAVAMVQFHQSFSYEDFIQGYRPNSDGTFHLKNGIFYNICEKAKEQGEKPFILIIDEINRGNLSKIFGELMMLIENDKRGEEFALPLTYSQDITETFYVPENLYIIGTMNTADRSLAMVDYALRRRFSFVNINPQFESDKFRSHLKQNGVSDPLAEKIVSKLSQLNEVIRTDSRLGEGFLIGHSYFCAYDANCFTEEEWYASVIKNEIVPLLHEYWFDDKEQVEAMILLLTQ